MKRILQITGCLNNGGTEAFVMNHYRNTDHAKIQFDFVTYHTQKEHFNDEIEALGGIVYTVPAKKKPFRCFLALRELGRQYDTVHLHTSSALCFFELLALKSAGVKNLIGHSHGISNRPGWKDLAQRLCRPLFTSLCDYRFACSVAAGNWLFGKKRFSKYGRVWPNAIELEAFSYDPGTRERLRTQYAVGGSFLIGHVGRFSPVKNHSYLLDILHCLLERGEDVKLMLVGWGEGEEEIKRQAQRLGMQSRILFMGARDDVHLLMQAMDIFVLPSFFEGLPVVGIEAQAAGLNCLLSDRVTDEIAVTGLVSFADIGQLPGIWADKVLEIKRSGYPRSGRIPELVQKGYHIPDAAKKLEEYYLSLCGKGKK